METNEVITLILIWLLIGSIGTSILGAVRQFWFDRWNGDNNSFHVYMRGVLFGLLIGPFVMAWLAFICYEETKEWNEWQQ